MHKEHPVLGTFPSTEKGSGQEEEFKASLSYIAILGQPGPYRRPCLIESNTKTLKRSWVWFTFL